MPMGWGAATRRRRIRSNPSTRATRGVERGPPVLGMESIGGLRQVATAKMQEGDGARHSQIGAEAGDVQAKPHVFQYAITPTRWPTADPQLLSEWRENVFAQLGSHPGEVEAGSASHPPLREAQGNAEKPSAMTDAEAGGGRDGEAQRPADAADEPAPVAGDGPSDAGTAARRARRRRHEAVDLAVLVAAESAAPEGPTEPSSAPELAGEAAGVGAVSASSDEVPAGVLTPSQIVRGDPLRLPDDVEGRRRGKVRSHERGGVMAVDPETVSVSPTPQPSGKRPQGVVVDVEATESVPPAPASKGFKRWRRTRPFWAGLLSMLGGAAVAAGPVSLLHIVAFTQSSVPLGAAVGILIFIMGLLEWIFPFYAILTGVITVVLALVSLISSSFGGLFIGMLLSLVGGAMAVAWRPAQPKNKKSKKTKAPNLPNTPSASA